MVWSLTAAEPPRARRRRGHLHPVLLAPARCRAAATCAPRTSGRPSFMDSGDHGSSATFSRPAWPQAAAVARGARAWLREVVIMSELGLIAPAARHMMHGHHLVHRGWEEHPRTWCFASAPVEASCAAANITTPRSFGAAFSHAHGAVAPSAGLRRAPARNMGSRACREAPGANGHLSIGRPVHLSSGIRRVTLKTGLNMTMQRRRGWGGDPEIIKEVLCRSYMINKAVMSAMQSYSDQAGKK